MINNPIYLTFIFFILFYILFPLAKKVYQNNYWKNIRSNIIGAKNYSVNLEREDETKQVFLGILDAIENNKIWVTYDNEIACIHLRDGKTFLLPSHSGRSETGSHSYQLIFMERISQKHIAQSISSLSTSKVLVVGDIMKRTGLPEVKPELVVFYDGNENRIFQRIIASTCARHSIVSMLNFILYGFGMLSFGGLILYSLFYYDGIATKLYTTQWTLFIFPIFILLPPALLFTYLFRKTEIKIKRVIYKRGLARILPLSEGTSVELKKSEFKLNILNSLYRVLSIGTALGSAYIIVRVINFIL